MGGTNLKINKMKFEIAKARACKTNADLEHAGVSRNTLIAALKRQKARPETVGKIALALGCDVTELIDTED